MSQLERENDDDIFVDKDFSTRALHIGQLACQWTSRAVVPPIVLSSTYAQVPPELAVSENGDSHWTDLSHPLGLKYDRSRNLTRESLEKCLASLELAKHSIVFSSGLAALASTTQLLKAGDHIVAGDELYGGTTRFFRTLAAKFELTIEYVNFLKSDKVAQTIKPNTKLVWFESPTNPLLQVIDIEAVCRAVRGVKANVIIAIDNTFMGPYFQSPLKLGVDIVMNSLTKYINGHSDVIMGSISTNRTDLHEQLKYLQKAVGSVPSPFDCYLVNRGIKTLALRMEVHARNAFTVAKYLETNPMVLKVIYLGLESHPQHSVVLKQCSGFGGMISFYIKGTLNTTKAFLSKLQLFTLAYSLGAVESLVEIPSLMTHLSLDSETREALGITDTLIRLSIGVENVEDIIQDLDCALKYAFSVL